MVFLKKDKKRLICYASGAMRGVYYAGVMKALDEEGIQFSDIAGISVGSTAGAWHGAGQAQEVLDAWEALGRYGLSYHPFLNRDKAKNLDWLIHNISLPFLDIKGLKQSGIQLHVATSQVLHPSRWSKGEKFVRRFFRFKDDFSNDRLIMAIRASCWVPFINGIFSAIKIDGNRYLDGGLTGRIPIDCADLEAFDEVWIVAASPNGIKELDKIDLSAYERPEFIVITPSSSVPVGRGDLDIDKFYATAEMGFYDTKKAIKG
ncbi:MAG: patatin-like phospholipase family protein [Thermodesulfobacteriota bacterium]|nr:patatin-like phospholipase family protein [Thermodesulfobacteriota bacterium]